MWILFAALSAVLLLILIRQRILYRKAYPGRTEGSAEAAKRNRVYQQPPHNTFYRFRKRFRPASRCAHLRQEIRGGC